MHPTKIANSSEPTLRSHPQKPLVKGSYSVEQWTLWSVRWPKTPHVKVRTLTPQDDQGSRETVNIESNVRYERIDLRFVCSIHTGRMRLVISTDGSGRRRSVASAHAVCKRPILDAMRDDGHARLLPHTDSNASGWNTDRSGEGGLAQEKDHVQGCGLILAPASRCTVVNTDMVCSTYKTPALKRDSMQSDCMQPNALHHHVLIRMILCINTFLQTSSHECLLQHSMVLCLPGFSGCFNSQSSF